MYTPIPHLMLSNLAKIETVQSLGWTRLCSHWAGFCLCFFASLFDLFVCVCFFVFLFFFKFFGQQIVFIISQKKKKYRESQKTTEPYFEIILYPGLLRGNCTPNQKLACFVLYFKIIHTFLKIIYATFSKLFKELKNGIESLNWPIGF